MFFKGLVPLVGEEKAKLWPQKLGIVTVNYHGEKFQGNECRALLGQADSLMDLEIYEEVGPFKLVPFISAFKAMYEIVHAYFSSRTIELDTLEGHIKTLKNSVLATEVSQSLKIHIIFDHLKDGLRLLGGRDGLGVWSEQAGESIHREFLIYWEKYKVHSLNNLRYPDRFKNAVVDFSSQHI